MQTLISTDDYVRDPYAYFAARRQEHPVSWVNLFHLGPVWLVTGYREADTMLKDTRFLRDERTINGPGRPDRSEALKRATDVKYRTFIVRDGEFHARVRGHVNKAFTHSIVTRLRPLIEDTARGLLDAMRGRREHDLLGEFATLLPLWVICDLVGVPREAWSMARTYTDAFMKYLDFHTTPADHEAAAIKMIEAETYFLGLVEARRRHPTGGDDVISRLLAVDDNGTTISDEEIAATCLLMLAAGHETTMNLIANGYYLLLSRPEQYERVRRDRSLVANAVEEMLRYEPGAFTTGRWVSEDTEFFGQPLERGQFAIVALGAANRDPRVNPDPDRFDVERSPVKHLAFSAGIHYCFGAHLARLEGQICLDMLLTRLENPVIAEEPRWANRIAVRGFDELRIDAEVV